VTEHTNDLTMNTPRNHTSRRRQKAFLAVLALGCTLCAQANSNKSAAPAISFSANWTDTSGHPAIAAFSAWAERYATLQSETDKTAALPEGVSLAKERKVALQGLIQRDPARALTLAVPVSIREKLPAQIETELETRVSGLGDYSVVCAFPAPGHPIAQSIRRYVSVNGRKYDVSTYGRRLGQTSKYGIPLHGIAVGGLLALHESTIRVLDPGETPDPSQTVQQVVSGAQPLIAAPRITAQIGNAYYQFGSAELLARAETALEASESGLGPNPDNEPATVIAQIVTNPNGDHPTPQGLTPWTSGRKRVLIIRVDFSDIAGDPIDFTGNPLTANYVQGIADNEVAPYYLQSSYRATSLTNTTTTQLYRLPDTAVSYATAGDNDKLHADAKALANVDYPLTNYDRIIVVFANLSGIPNSQITYGGLANLGSTNVWVNGEFDFRVVAHELGHTYGLLHAALWQVTDFNPISPLGSPIEYGDDYDTIGGNFANYHGTDFNPANKNRLGWLPDNKVLSITTNGIYRLFTFDLTNFNTALADQTLALKLVKDSERTYWFGVRRDFPGNPSMDQGVYTIWDFNTPGSGGGGGFQTALLDLNTPGFGPSPGAASDSDAALAIGQVFSDPAVNLLITPVGSGGTAPNFYVDLQIGSGSTVLKAATNYLVGGNGNGLVDMNECNDLFIVLTNSGATTGTNVELTISTTNSGVFLPQPVSSYPNIPPASAVTNVTPFKISTTPDYICGSPIFLDLTIKTVSGLQTAQLRLPSGTNGLPLRFDNFTPVAIPDGYAPGTNSFIFVNNITSSVEKVTVSLYMNHRFDVDMLIDLVAPDGTTVPLSTSRGGPGQDFGIACSPDSSRTTFDDNAATSIANGNPPFMGTFRPEQPLAAFIGKSGTNVNGLWRLHLTDNIQFGLGTNQCWSLFITPSSCVDGGGQCPGLDLGITMTDAPDPATIGGNLVYTMVVSNAGPGVARGAVVSQTLPGTVQYVSGFASQGSCGQAGGVVTAPLGNLAVGATATVTVTVTPNAAGTIFSTANVSSSDPELNPLNNSVTVSTIVTQPTADLAVGIADAPDPTLVGGNLTYVVSVTNNGPAGASGILVSNVLPPTVHINSTDRSQGNLSIVGNTVLFSPGFLAKNAYATCTLNVTPLQFGVMSATSYASAIQPDPFLANNTATATTSVGQAADVSISLSANPNPVVLGSNLTYSILVTNFGPNTATNVLVSQTLPVGVTMVSNFLSQGTASLNGSTFTCNLGTIVNGAKATVLVYVTTTRLGSLGSTATVTASQADPNTANNSASATAQVAPPFVSIVPTSATLKTESFSPPNGTIDSNETVTVDFRLQNNGNVANTNLVATLQGSGGVTPITLSQNYNILRPIGIPGGAPVARSFSFTARGPAGGTILATLNLHDAGGYDTNVTFSFILPSTISSNNTAAITIPDYGRSVPYSNVIHIGGLTGQVAKVTASINGFSHSYPHDVSALLVSPSGVKVMLMSHVADQSSVENATLTFDDQAGNILPDVGSLASDSYQPTNYPPAVTFTNPAPPYLSSLRDFNGLNPNGDWVLYVMDDVAGDSGGIANGWSLSLQMVTPVNQLADVGLVALSSTNSVAVGDSLAYTFVISNAGPATASGVVFSNPIPNWLVLLSATSSAGNINTNTGTVIANLGSLGSGSSVTVTELVSPTSAALSGNANSAVLGNPASVSAFETDLHIGDNSTNILTTVVAQQADLSVSITPNPATVVLGSNLTFTVSVTNNSPGVGIATFVTNSIPAGTTFGSATSSQGSVSFSGGNVVANLGALPSGASASVYVVVTANSLGTNPVMATVSSAQTDGNSLNNSATGVVQIVAPFTAVQVTSVTLTSESLQPANGVLDAGEKVTALFYLQNVGTVPVQNLGATMLQSGGISPAVGSASNYFGTLLPGAAAVAGAYTFTNTSSGGAVVATLQLSGSGVSGTASFTFGTPNSFASGAISIPDHGVGSPYPSVTNISGLTGYVSKVTVKLNGFSHSFPSDVSVLLVNPAGKDVLLMSHAGSGFTVGSANLTFDDTAVLSLPNASQISTGTYRPSSYGAAAKFPSPAPAAPHGAALGGLNGIDPNGTWALYVVDDSTGDQGSISSWTLNITTVNPLAPVADLGIGMTVSGGLAYQGNGIPFHLSITNLGPSSASGVVINDVLPAGFALLSGTSSQGTIAAIGSSVYLNFGTLAPGATANATLVLSSSQTGTFINVATVTGGVTDLLSANNTAVASVTVNSAPTLTAVLSNSVLVLKVSSAIPGNAYEIQASANLGSWLPIHTNTAASDGSFSYTDTASPGFNSRYYRVRGR
jgi:uncharacterized repeat protein (TIGR01451 family)